MGQCPEVRGLNEFWEKKKVKLVTAYFSGPWSNIVKGLKTWFKCECT